MGQGQDKTHCGKNTKSKFYTCSSLPAPPPPKEALRRNATSQPDGGAAAKLHSKNRKKRRGSTSDSSTSVHALKRTDSLIETGAEDERTVWKRARAFVFLVTIELRMCTVDLNGTTTKSKSSHDTYLFQWFDFGFQIFESHEQLLFPVHLVVLDAEDAVQLRNFVLDFAQILHVLPRAQR